MIKEEIIILLMDLPHPANGFKPGLDQNIVWETLRDFDTDQTDVMIRLIAKDGLSVTTNPAYSDSFDVNNGRPSIQMYQLFQGHQMIL